MANKATGKSKVPPLAEEREKVVSGWATMAEWGRVHGMNRSSVLKAVNAGRLESNGEKGRLCRVRGPLLDSADSPTGKDLLTLKQEKLAADIKLAEQRLAEHRREWETVMADKTIAAFVGGFTPFKTRLAELRLGAKETSELNDLFDVCVAGFELELRKAVKEGRE